MRKSLLTVALGLAMLSVSAAHAQGAQGYMGGGVGWTNVSADCSEFDRCDKSGTGGKLYAGYRFANQFAVEAVYVNWGKGTAGLTENFSAGAGPLLAQPITATGDLELKTTGLGIGVAYFMPFSANWNGVARVGAIRNDGKLTFTASAKGFTESETESKKSTVAYFGVGLGYNLTPNLALTGEADFSRVKYAFDGESQTENVRLVTVGLRYSF